MGISVSEVRGIVQKKYLKDYNEFLLTKMPTNFLQSFFKVTTTPARQVNFEVERGLELISVDIDEFSDGQRNKWSITSEKGFIPPKYHEYYDVCGLASWDRVYNESSEVTGNSLKALGSEMALRMVQMRAKIARAKEKQALQVFESGVLTLVNGTNINFKRKAASIVDVSGSAPWSTAGSPIGKHISAGCEFIREFGKNADGECHVIMDGPMWGYVQASNYFTNKANFVQVKLINVTFPQIKSTGAVYMGSIVAETHVAHIWVYNDGYNSDASTFVKYWNPKKVVIIPTKGTDFEMAHAGIRARLSGDKGDKAYIGRVGREYYNWDRVDDKKFTHEYHIKSAPIAIPKSVDQIYTLKTLV